MRRYKKSYGGRGRRSADPTPTEIRKRCREIQSSWTRQVERTRRGVGEAVPMVTIGMHWRSGVLSITDRT